MMQHIRTETPATLKAALAQLEVDTTFSGAAKSRRRTQILQRLLTLEGQATAAESAILNASPALATATVTEAPVRQARRHKPARSEEAPAAQATKGKGKGAAPVETESEGNKAGRGGVAGLTGREVRVLIMLADEGSTEKSRLKKECGSGSAVLGAVNREGFGVRGGGLAGKGLIIGGRKEGEPETVYSITPAGRKALAQVRRKLAGK
jgi:hypothetical protein